MHEKPWAYLLAVQKIKANLNTACPKQQAMPLECFLLHHESITAQISPAPQFCKLEQIREWISQFSVFELFCQISHWKHKTLE